MTTIRQATAADLPKVTKALGSAFAEDPLFRWIAGADPNEAIERKLHILFGAMAKAELSSPDHLAFTTVDGAGAAVWKHPNNWKMPPAS